MPGVGSSTNAVTPGISDEEVTPGIPDEEVTPGEPEEPSPGQPEEPSPGQPDEPEPAPPGTPGGGDTGGRGMTAGTPEEPSPAAPGSPGGAEHSEKQGEISGPQVALMGTVSMDLSISSKVYIDVFDGDQRNTTGPRPSIVTVAELAGAGGFRVDVPLAAKRVWMGAYADTNGDERPTKGEPTAWYSGNPIYLDSPPDHITIELVMESKPTGLGLDFGE